MYDLHRLRLLRELSHRGTLAAVASALGYNPSSVSHQLTVLEREVGVPLLEPAGRGVRLTPAAVALVEHTEVVLRELERAEASVAATRTDVAGVVRLAAFQTAAHAVLPDLMTLLRGSHPGLDLRFAHVDADAAIPALLARDFDVVLTETYPGGLVPAARGVTSRVVLDDPLLLAVPHGGAPGGLADLADAVWAAEHRGSSHRSWFESACAAAGFVPDVAFESADLLLHARLVAAGRAAAVLPRLAVAAAPDLDVVELGAARAVSLSVRTGSEGRPAVRATVDALDAVLRAHAGPAGE